MNRQKIILFAVALGLIGATAGALGWLKTHQRLGRPGLKTSALPGTRNLRVDLPETVNGYTSAPVAIDIVTSNTLPQDTSYGQRIYQAADGFQASINVVMMGTDRTSIHKPQYCLSGQGWQIDAAASGLATVPVYQPRSYALPVMKLTATKQGVVNGEKITARAVYVYWFVAEDRLTARHWQRMWWMAENLMRTGELQRWAYVGCMAVCEPGREDATFERMKQLLAGTVPQFQLATGMANDR